MCGFANDRANHKFDGIKFQGKELQLDEIPNVINYFLISISDSVPALNICSTEYCGTEYNELTINEFDVYRVLSTLNVSKSSLDSILNNKLLRSLSDVLAAPICSQINNSLQQGVVPAQ